MVADNEELFVSQGDQPEEHVFSMPAEALEKLRMLGLSTPVTSGQPLPMVEQVPIVFDTAPLASTSEPEVIITRSGPVVVRRRITKTVLYRGDGRKETVVATQKQRYLNKRDASGKPIFYTEPPASLPANEAICQYCTKLFRRSTPLEIASNMAKPGGISDEAARLLAAQYPDAADNATRSINDLEFKLAEHVRLRHGRLAAFTNDPLYRRIREVDESQGIAKRSRGRPRKEQ